MEIKTRALHTGGTPFPEEDPQVGLIGGFIRTETGVSVNSEKRLIDFRDGYDVRRKRSQLLSHCHNKSLGRVHDKGFIIFPVSLKPFCIVVSLQLPEKPDSLFGKSLKSEISLHDSFLLD